MKKALFLLALILSLTLAFGGRASAGEKKYRLALCMSSLDTFLSSLADAAVKRASEIPGVELTVMDAQDDTVKQTDQFLTFLNDKYDGILIVVAETSSAPPMVEAAAKAGVPVIWTNRNPFFGQPDIPANNWVLSSNSILEGARGMEYAGKLMGGKGNVIILQGTLGHEATYNRTEGVKKVIREEYPDIKILDEQTGNWFRDQGMTVTENLITAHGDKINAVLANNDEMALGALLALQQYGRNDVIVCGVDGTPDGIASVASGTGLHGTSYQDPVAQGAGSIDLMLRILAGEKPEQRNLLPVDFISRENVKDFKRP